MWFK
jgi:hypothetical protein